MDSELIVKLFSSLLILLTGIMAKFSLNDGLQPVKKYWIYFIIVGGISLIYEIYSCLLK
jgi:hypothetical protein